MKPMKVLTFGTFDRLHPGHIAYLTQAKKHGDLYIIVARAENVLHIKGRAPTQTVEERIHALQEAFPDATVQAGDASDYLKPVRDIHPDIIVMGYDQKLPPGVSEEDLSCAVERAEPFEPSVYKTSLLREND